MIKPDELHNYMRSLLTDEQKAAYKDLLPVIVRGIIKAAESKN